MDMTHYAFPYSLINHGNSFLHYLCTVYFMVAYP